MFHVAQRILIPVVFLLGALIVRSLYKEWPLALADLMPQLPYILLGIAALMAILANHSRDLGLAVAMFCLYWTIRAFLQEPLDIPPAGGILYIVAFLSPLICAFLLAIPEYGWRHPLGIAAVVSSPLLLLVFGRLFAFSENLFHGAANATVADPFFGTQLSDGAGWLFILLILACTATSALQRSSTNSAILGSALMSFVALGWLEKDWISSSMFSGIGSLLIFTQLGNLLNIGFRDELTQIGNRRALLQAVRVPMHVYTLAIVDVDHFKKINDQHGHDFGDQALKVIANHLQAVGEGGKAFRYGGEEFCLLFKNRTCEDVLDTLDELRRAIASYDMQLRDQKRPWRNKTGQKRRGATKRRGAVRLSVSMGVVDSSETDDFHTLVTDADKALYRAKANGRNRIELA